MDKKKSTPTNSYESAEWENEDWMDDDKKKFIPFRYQTVPSYFEEAINTLRGNLQLSDSSLKIIVMTSALAGEGKTSLAFFLSKSLAELKKKVIFVDCDIRNSDLSSYFEIDREKPGLSDYLSGNALCEQIIYPTLDPWLNLIPAGSESPTPGALFSGAPFTHLFSFLKNSYDYVIVDSPPLNEVIDGLLIARRCDGAVLVVERGATQHIQVEKAYRQMQNADINVLGVVLNKTLVQKESYAPKKRKKRKIFKN